ncbi:MAG TPA: hypothetical protein VF723_04405 [Pyrinomonadaceae bacterium]|jgi:hypothetical protein
MRRTTAFLLCLTIAAATGGCRGNSGANSTVSDPELNQANSSSERANSSNMAPTGGPGPEPENAVPSKGAPANKNGEKTR